MEVEEEEVGVEPLEEEEAEPLEEVGCPEELLRVDMPCWEYRSVPLFPKMEDSAEHCHRSTQEITPTPTSSPMNSHSTKT